jgi:hypothetical protein
MKGNARRSENHADLRKNIARRRDTGEDTEREGSGCEELEVKGLGNGIDEKKVCTVETI